jgi:hypothetical protein
VQGQPFKSHEIETRSRARGVEGGANDQHPTSRHHQEGLQDRPGRAVVPRLRGLLDPERGAGRLRRARQEAARDGDRLGHRLQLAFPYYMETYGFHTIHGRAPAIATGVKVATPSSTCGSSPATATRCRSAATTSSTPAPQRGAEDPAVQQPHLRAHQGPVLADSASRARSPSRSPLGSVDYPFSPIALALGAGGDLRRAQRRHPRTHLEETI